MENAIIAQNIKRYFKAGDGTTVHALDGVSMEIKKGTLAILKGRSGSGKTTLLNILSALDMPTEGSVQFLDKNLEQMTEKDREMLRRYEMGFVFQSIALIPTMTAYENVEFEYLMREEIVIVLNRSHPLAKKKLLHMSELREEPFIAGWRGSSSNTLMVSLCHAAGFVPKFCAYYSEMERIFRAISENEGISIIPYDSLKDTLKEHEDLTYAFIADPGNYRLLKLCWPKKNFESRRNQMFREYALNYFADLEKRLMEEKQCVFHNNCITHKEYILEYF